MTGLSAFYLGVILFVVTTFCLCILEERFSIRNRNREEWAATVFMGAAALVLVAVIL